MDKIKKRVILGYNTQKLHALRVTKNVILAKVQAISIIRQKKLCVFYRMEQSLPNRIEFEL